MTRGTVARGLVVLAIATGVALAAGVLYARRGADAPVVATGAVTRGPIVRNISATGTVEPVTTVEVGTQVSGAIQALLADFNSVVTRGQVLARLDPALYQSAVDQARANLTRAGAEVDRLQVAAADAVVKRERARELSARHLIPATDLDAAELNVRTTDAQVRSARAQVTQAAAALRQAEVNLAKTVITAPIDGIVIARNVDVGQTVAASLSAPTLFLLAGGLDRMQIKANIDESDLGVVARGQPVTFTVDAYPGERFTGTVEQVRLSPVVEQNVVTYAAIIGAANPGLKLKPGLTATVTIEVARLENVLRLPAAALRFRPNADEKQALGAAGLEATGTSVWLYADGRMRPVAVATGVSDGAVTEVKGDAVAEGALVVTRVATAEGAAASGAP